MAHHPASSLMRQRIAQSHARVTNIELFFDLVFVFAVTQLSHALHQHLDLGGVIHTSLLFLAVWWVWIYTSWTTNWLDPEKVPVRLMLFILMLAGLLLSASLPKAFGDNAMLFAITYSGMHIGRTLFMLWAMRHSEKSTQRNMQRVLIWMLCAAPLWILGACMPGDTRLLLWIAALGMEYVSPALGFWVPGLGRSLTADWNVEGGHMAERCSLFVIIALGESILDNGSSFAGLPWTAASLTAFGVNFIGSAAMWWIYFNIGAERGSHHISKSADPGRIARVVYTYVHLLIIAGIIVGAVANELLVANPTGHLQGATLATVAGSAILFLIGNLFFKWLTSPHAWLPLSHLVGLGLIAVLLLGLIYYHDMSPLVLGTNVSAILVLVAVWETISLRGPRRIPGA